MLDPRTHHPMNSFQLYDETRHKTYSYPDTWEATNSGLWPSKPAQFGREYMEMDVHESGINSPPLWTTSPPHRKNHYRSLSPSSRTEAIVRGQRELMEMVRNMPETNYELSLKDLVEHHKVHARGENREEEKNLSVYKRESGGGGGRRVDKMTQVKRNGNFDRGGFYLKVVFPFSFGSKDKKNKKKNKNESLGNSSSKVSPKPSASEGSTKGVDKEWWKKSPSAYRESDSGESSVHSESIKSSGSSSSNSNSNSSSRRRSNSRRHEKSGGSCWPFIRRPKSKTKK